MKKEENKGFFGANEHPDFVTPMITLILLSMMAGNNPAPAPEPKCCEKCRKKKRFLKALCDRSARRP